MKFPNLSDFLPEQLDALLSPIESDLFIVGPPGSGKTSIAVHRAMQIAKQGKSTVLITRGRLLTSLAQRLGNGNFQALTMHKCVSRNYSARFQRDVPAPRHQKFDYLWDEVMRDYAPFPAPHYDHVIVDEGQNVPAGFYPWVVKFGAKHTTVFADEDQTTDTDRARIQDIRNAPMPPPQRLTTNHRNTYEIAQVAEFFHRSKTLAAGIVPDHKRGRKPALIRFNEWDEIVSRIANRFRNTRPSIGIIVDKVETANMLHRLLKSALSDMKPRIQNYHHKLPMKDVNAIDITTAGITLLTGKSAIGLEFECVYIQDLPRQTSPLSPEVQRYMYMACARAENELFFIDGPVPMSDTELNNLPAENLLTR